LFTKVGDHVVTLETLKSFTPQNLANTVWAYATANQLRSDLFEKVGIAVVHRGHFQSFKQKDLANIAWAYTVANADASALFNNTFTDALLVRRHEFGFDGMCQLYQWHLWQTKELSHTGLPEELREQCYQAFITSDATVSRFQRDVVHELTSMDLTPVEEYRTPSGYSIDALVEVNGRRVGFEVHGPSDFVDRKPTASTILRLRQIRAVYKIPLVSVPHWEWAELGTVHEKKQQYLRGLLDSTEPQQ
jgi:hypothetical protein